MGGFASSFLSLFRRKDPQTPIVGILPRLKNLLAVHYRGLIGCIVPIVALSWQGKKGDHARTVSGMWILMFWLFLWQPVNVPVTGLLPIFVLPMLGAMSTDRTAACYMNESIALFVLTNMLILLLNNCGLDRRIALWFMCAGDASQFSAKRLVLKCSFAGFILSMFSSRLISCSIITGYMTKNLMDLQSATARNVDPDYDKVRHIVNNAIQTSCSIGSIGILHSSYGVLAFRAIFYQSAADQKVWPDIFNYLEYSSFAIPVALVMFILNAVYNMALVHLKAGKEMSTGSMNSIRNALLKNKAEIPSKITLHEKLAIFFTIFYLAIFFTRWTKHFAGWSNFRQENDVPGVMDATVAAIFVILLHALPNSYRFTKFVTAKKKSQIEPIKTESAILWWRFVDKNTNYGYILLIGSGVALSAAIRLTGLDGVLSENTGKLITDHTWPLSLFLVCLVTVVLANSMTSVAVVVVWLPFIMHMTAAGGGGAPAEGGLLRTEGTENQWPTKVYLGALAIGIGSSLGFMWPFLYTPAYFCHYTGKVPKLKMCVAIGIGSSLGFMWPFLYTPAYFCHYTGKVPKLKMAINGIGSAVICLLVLWIMITYYAPVLWNTTIEQVDAPAPPGKPTEAAPAAGGDLLFL